MSDSHATRMAYMMCEMQAAVTRRHPPPNDIVITRGYIQPAHSMLATAEANVNFFKALARQFLRVHVLRKAQAPLTWINPTLNLTLFMGHAHDRGFTVQAIRHVGDPRDYFRAEEAAMSGAETSDEASDDDDDR